MFTTLRTILKILNLKYEIRQNLILIEEENKRDCQKWKPWVYVYKHGKVLNRYMYLGSRKG